MNNAFAGLTALGLALFLWAIRRKPIISLNKNSNSNSLTGINGENKALVSDGVNLKKAIITSKATELNIDLQIPQTIQERILLQKKLNNLMDSDPETRLKTIIFCQKWKHPSARQILLKGLHDSDSRVVLAAAKGVESFRGKSKLSSSQTERPPRNVARMR